LLLLLLAAAAAACCCCCCCCYRRSRSHSKAGRWEPTSRRNKLLSKPQVPIPSKACHRR
jgi:hypothetical protein